MIRKTGKYRTLKTADLQPSHEALRETEGRYRRIFEDSKDMVYMTSADGKLLDINRAGVEIFGYGSKEEVMQVYARDTFLYPEDQKRLMNEVMKVGFVKDFEVKLKRKDGTPIDVLMTANARRDHSGKVIGYDGIIKDISDRKRVEEELIQRTRELEALNEMGTLINQTLVDLDTVFAIALEKAVRLTGWEDGIIYLANDEEQILERKYRFNPPAHVGEEAKFIRYGEGVSGKAFSLRKPVIASIDEYSSDRIAPPLIKEGIQTLLGFPLISKGKAIGTINLFSRSRRELSQRDIHLLESIGSQIGLALENARLFSNVAKAKSEWETTFDAVIQGIIIIDRNYRILRVNKDTVQRLGVEYRDLIGKKCFEGFEHRDKPCERCCVSDVFMTKKPGFAERENKYTKRLIRSSAFPIFDEAGITVGAVELVNDITEEKRLEIEREVVNNVNKILASSLDMKEVIKAAHAELKRVLDSERMSIVLFDEEGEGFQYFALEKDYDAEALGGGAIYPLKGTHFQKMAETGLPEIIENVKSDSWISQELWNEGIRSSLLFPLEYKGEIIGTINFGSRETDRFSESQFSLLRQIAPGLGIAIQDALLLETTRKLAQENATMAEIGRIISSTLNINDVYERFAEKVRELIPFDRITILIANPRDNTISTAYVTGLNVPDRIKTGILPLASTFVEEAIRTRTKMLIQIEDLKKVTERFPELLRNFQAGIRSLMAIPLISKDEVIGVLSIQSLKPNAYTESEVKLAERVGNQIAGAIANAQLYSEHKQAEEALKKNHEELIKKNKEIDESRRDLQLAIDELEGAYKELKASQAKILQQEKMASIGQLAAGVAHEINNPMAFISSNLGTLDKYVHRLTEFVQAQSEVIESLQATEAIEGLKRKEKELKLDYIAEDIKGLITESLEGSERVRKIVQGLKSFARVDEAEYKYTDMNECMESTINIVWNELKYKAILKKDYGNLPLTKCYPQQMNQVFMNLLINAGDAIEKQGEITIKTWDEDGSIWVAISDTGRGIQKEQLSKIFEPFFTTKEVGKGTGLGLSITYEIVQKHNGEITVESEVGKGTTFTVRIPIV